MESVKKNDADIFIENSEELEELSYENSSPQPLFEQINVTKKDFSLFELYRKYKKKQLVLDVDFQRKEVWDYRQKCELIESILMGLPLPIFYLQQNNNSSYVVVDGKQRLSSIFQYFDGKYTLKNLKILSFLNGRRYDDLNGELGIYQTQFEDYQIYAHVILPTTPDSAIFDIFDRVNRGGTKLNKQEIRNALYHGNTLKMIDEVTKLKIFENASGIIYEKDKRMKGSYIILRFVAFYLYEEGLFNSIIDGYKYDGNLDELLKIVIKYLNDIDSVFLDNIKKVVTEALGLCYVNLGRGAFRKGLNQSNPVNMNLFETEMYYMACQTSKYSAAQISKEKNIENIWNLLSDPKFIWSIGDGRDSAEKVSCRFDKVRELLSGEKYDRKDWN